MSNARAIIEDILSRVASADPDVLALNRIMEDARGWIIDAFPAQEDEAYSLTDAQIVQVINREYDGGWGQFALDVDA